MSLRQRLLSESGALGCPGTLAAGHLWSTEPDTGMAHAPTPSSLTVAGRVAALRSQESKSRSQSPKPLLRISETGSGSGEGALGSWDDFLEDWGYCTDEGASEWGLNFPEANGENQSPININSHESEYDESLAENPLNFSYILCRETDMCNNGHTVVSYLRYKPGDAGFRTDVIPRSTLSGGPLPKNQEYELAEFRFHWGREDARGSEHTVNFKAFPMELHLLHWNTSLYASLEEALGKPDGVAIIALFIQIGREHTGLKILSDQLEDVHYKGRQKCVTTAFNPNCLLPDPMLRDYWTYDGSLTSPPCSEKVTWIIFRYPLTVSHLQIEEFRRLRSYPKGALPQQGEDGILVDNFRPTQPLNDRVVRASFL